MVVQFRFPLFLGMYLISVNEFVTKEIKFEPRIKLNHNTDTYLASLCTHSLHIK